jgi:hypothetical protein
VHKGACFIKGRRKRICRLTGAYGLFLFFKVKPRFSFAGSFIKLTLKGKALFLWDFISCFIKTVRRLIGFFDIPLKLRDSSFFLGKGKP